MTSTRLPGKSLADIGGEPALALLLRRLRGACRIGETVVATTTDMADDPIAKLATELGVGVARGSREDVLARFLAAIGERSGPIVRITGDCPLIDPSVVDATVERFASVPGCAYASNIVPRTFPDGLDVEVADARALREIAGDHLAPAEREHVTLALRGQPTRFPAASLMSPDDLGKLRWTVDDEQDLEFVRALVWRLGDRRYEAGMTEILAAVRSPPSLADFGAQVRG
jgi:spore coat polysaccharide biosynthesis protein SpsF (cytidylyltransferase family)